MVVHEKLMRKLIEPTSLSRSYNPCNYYECTSRDSLGPGAYLFFKIYRASVEPGPPASGWGYHLPLHGLQGFPRLSPEPYNIRISAKNPHLSPEPSEPYNILISAKNLQDFQIPLDPTAIFPEIFNGSERLF